MPTSFKFCGLYQFIDSNFLDSAQKNLLGIAIEPTISKDGSPYFYIPLNLAQEPNPFSHKGMILGSGAHLRIDQKYYGFKTDNMQLRNLSYCHATEYFVSNEQKLTVHYYFDRWGEFTHATCRFEEEEEKPFYKASSYEKNLIAKRAYIYTDNLSKLIQAKNNKFKELTDKLEFLRDKILDSFKVAKINQKQLDKLIEEHSTLVNKKNLLDDHNTNTNDDSFVAFLDKLVEQNQIAKKIKPVIQDIDTLPREKSDVTTSVVNAQPQKSDIAEKINFEEIISSLANRLKILEKSNLTLTDNNIENYLQEYEDLKLALALLFLNDDKKQITGAQKQQVHKLLNKLLLMPDAINLFKHALNTYNVQQLKILYPKCKQQISYPVYTGIIKKFSFARDLNDSEFTSLIEACDFLFVSCDLFAQAIAIPASGYIKNQNGNDICLLASAYAMNNKIYFTKILEYGARPNIPWVIGKNDREQSWAIEAMLAKIEDTSFYIDKLIEYGFDPSYQNVKGSVSFDKNLEQTSHNIRKDDSQIIGKNALLKDMQNAKEFANFGFISNNPIVMTAYNNKTKRIDLFSSSLVKLTNHAPQKDTNNFYRALVKISSLSELLFSLYSLCLIMQVNFKFITASPVSGIKLLSKDSFNKELSNKSNINIRYNGVLVLFCEPDIKNFPTEKHTEFNINKQRLEIIFENINNRYQTNKIISEDADMAGLELRLMIYAMNNTMKNPMKDPVTYNLACYFLTEHYYCPLNLLLALRAPFTKPEQQIELIDNFANIADIYARNGTPSDKKHLLAKACYFYQLAIQASFDSPYPETALRLEVIKYCTQQREILNKIPETNRFKEGLKSYVRTYGQWRKELPKKQSSATIVAREEDAPQSSKARLKF